MMMEKDGGKSGFINFNTFMLTVILLDYDGGKFYFFLSFSSFLHLSLNTKGNLFF